MSSITSVKTNDIVIKKKQKLERILQPSFNVRSQQISDAIIDLMMQCEISLPSLKHGGMRRLGEVLNSGSPIKIASIQCPDYSYIKTDNPVQPYEFTFDSLGNDIGLIAQQVLKIAPLFHRTLVDIDIQHSFVFGLCDYEGLNPLTLQKVNLSEDQFMHQCRQSLKKFTECLQLSPLVYEASLITELEGVIWHALVDREAPPIIEQAKGSSRRSISQIYQTAANASMALYTKWFELDEKSDSYNEQLLQLTKLDAINFLSIALAFSKSHQEYPLIILSCDRPSMAFFYELVREVHEYPTCILHLNKPIY